MGRAGSRLYTPTGARVASVTASSAATALPTLGRNREVRINASQNAWLLFGGDSVEASIAATSFPISAWKPELVQVPEGATHFAVIRDTADGYVTLHATA